MEIFHRLANIRKALGGSQGVFAKKLGLSQSTYANYEKGSRALPDSVKDALSRFGINLHWLITGKGEMFLPEKEEEDDFPDDPEQGAAMLDHLLDLLLKKGIIKESDIPPPLPGVQRVNYADKMSKETYRMLQRQLAKAQEESERAQQEFERIKDEMRRYEARQSESDEVSEPEQEYGPHEREPVAAEGEEDDFDEEEMGVNVPLIGLIAAGQPLDIEAWPDEWRRISLRRDESPETHYLLEVTGTSMSEMGISDGALILIRRAQRVETSQIAVVYIPGEGVTLKRFNYDLKERPILKWEDGSGRFQELGEEDLIQGVFVRVIEK